VEVRTARPADLERCAEIQHLEPSREVAALMPSIDGARRLTLDVLRHAAEHEVVVADDGGTVVGFALTSTSSGSLRSYAVSAVRAFGVIGTVRLVAMGWSRQRVDFPRPDGMTLAELHVDPARRGEGIGGRLLDEVIHRHGDRPLSLTTRSDNPARRLYERHGFGVVSEKRDDAYERRTGSPGRVLMVRPARADGGSRR
jgi:ribosomal protein S18 acetylase RimI-like enzyme